MGSPSGHMAVGTVRSTGALLDVKTVGFRPRMVEIHVGAAVGWWQADMPDDTAYKHGAAMATADAITPLSDGFRLGVDADLNPATATNIAWCAWS